MSEKPTPVIGTPGGEPVSVKVAEPLVGPPPPVPATIAQESEVALHSQGQRTVSLMWEQTQMRLALSVVGASLSASLLLALFGKWIGASDTQLASVVYLYGVANLVIGFYFGRTNHQRVGGPGGDSAGTR